MAKRKLKSTIEKVARRTSQQSRHSVVTKDDLPQGVSMRQVKETLKKGGVRTKTKANGDMRVYRPKTDRRWQEQDVWDDVTDALSSDSGSYETPSWRP